METGEGEGHPGEDPADAHDSFVYSTLTSWSVETAWYREDKLMPYGEINWSTDWIYSRFQPVIWCQVDTAGQTAEHDEFT